MREPDAGAAGVVQPDDTARARETLEEATGTLARIPGPGIVPELAASMRGRLLSPGRPAAAFGQKLS